jgi:hypothetical protein
MMSPLRAFGIFTLAASLVATAASLGASRLEAQVRMGADPADVETIDGILGALYDVISGPAGADRDWDRFRSLFIDDARLIPTGVRPDGRTMLQVNSVDQYIERTGAALEERGFFEREIHRTVQHFGPVIHAFSTYESRWAEDDAEPFARGINSIQLLHDGVRWSIVNVYWHQETDETPIPLQFLPSGSR